MRITTNQMYTTANAHMLQNQKNLAAVQVQLTSGKKLQSLAMILLRGIKSSPSSEKLRDTQ